MAKNSIYSLIFFSVCFTQLLFGMNPMVYKQSDLFPLLEKLPDTPGKFAIACDTINLLKPSTLHFAKDYDFSNIQYLDLTTRSLTLHYALKVPTLSLKVNGFLTLGKSNEEMGILAATHGPLTVIADAIDGQYAKFYGKGPTLIESTIGDITLGDSIWGIDENIKQQYIDRYTFQNMGFGRSPLWNISQERLKRISIQSCFHSLKQTNGAYCASDSTLTIQSARNIFLNHGKFIASDIIKLTSPEKIRNLAGKISSTEEIHITTDNYDHIREQCIPKPYCSCIRPYPGSGPALLESLKTINFFVKTKVYNLASLIRAAQKILINGSLLFPNQNPQYIQEIQEMRISGITPNCAPSFIQSCTTQAGDAITMNLGDFKITGNMNASTVAIAGNTGSFINTERTRNTIIVTEPTLVNVTECVQQEAQKLGGFYQLDADGRVKTEFPFGAPSRIDDNNRVLLGNNQAIPLDWQTIINPLSGINFDLFLQQLISTHAGKILKTQGKSISAMLQENTQQWKQHNQKEIMSHEDVQHVNQSMLLTQIVSTPENQLQQHTMLCLAPNDINPYQSPGDIATERFSCITDNDQTHLNNRIVATGHNGITLQSTARGFNLQTQSYTVVSESLNSKTIMQCAMPQQQLIAPAGPVSVHSDKNITRTGTLIAAAHDVKEQSEHGSVIKSPLTLTTFTETRHEKNGLFSSSSRVETSLTHSALPCKTHAGTILHDKAHIAIQATAQQDIAQQEITYDAPQINIEGLVRANTFTSSEEKSGMFTDESKKSSKQTPFALPAHIQSPTVQFLGEYARVNANIHATELHDKTEKGIQFVAKVAQMLCSAQTLISSPLSSADIGFEAGYETMIPPMLMVEKIIRAQRDGCMLFESAIMDKNRTEIIGIFVETTYHLKQWQRNWHHVSPVFSDEALVVIALAITWYTQGMGVELLQPLLSSVTAATGMQLSAAGIAAVNAGISAVYSSATTSFLKTGDPINTAQHLVSPAHLQSLSFTMASAGLYTQLGSMLDINMEPGIKTLSQHIQHQALQGTVDSLLTAAITKTSPRKTLSKTVLQIPLKAIAAYASNQICAAYTHELIKQVGQALVGGLSGFAQEQSRKGFISGVTGAVTTETVGALLIADSQAIADSAIARLNKKGIQKTPANIQKAIAQEVHERMKLAKIAAASVAALTRQNPTIAAGAAANAIDNDIAIRGQLAALSEYQSLLAATSQAYATLHTHQEKTEQKKSSVNKKNTPRRPKSQHPKKSVDNDAAHDLVLASIEKSLNQNTYADLILEYAHNNNKQVQPKRSVYDRVVNPKQSSLIRETSRIIRISFVDALDKTIHVYSMVPNPVGMACFAKETGSDLYHGRTSVNEIVFNTALAYGFLKGIQVAAKGVKIVYQKGTGLIKDITDGVLNHLHQRRYTAQGRIPFVPNPRAGQWKVASIANDLILTSDHSTPYRLARYSWSKDNTAPFNVVGHGNPYQMFVDIATTHSKGLSQSNLLQLQENGVIALTATQLARLIRTAPGYQKGQHINLFSCSCGAKSNGIAQQLATRMGVSVSAFSKTLYLEHDGSKLSTFGPGINKFGVMKTFYPEKAWNYRLIALAALPGFILSGDTRHIQAEIPAETFHRWTYDSLWQGLD